LPIKLDLHVHTCYSHDGLTTPREVVFYSKKAGLDGVAITDHDTLEGALKLAKLKELLVIPGVEVTTADMHLLALNVTTPIPSGLKVQETIDKIHDAGGIAVACHPTAILKGSLKCPRGKFDAIEVINSSAFPFLFATNFNRKLANSLGLPQTAGSDAHYGPEIGFAYTVIDADLGVDEAIEAIKRGLTVPYGRRIPWRLRLKRKILGFKKKRF